MGTDGETHRYDLRKDHHLGDGEAGTVPTALLGRVSSVDWFVSLARLPSPTPSPRPPPPPRSGYATFIGAGLIGAVVTPAFLHLPGVCAVERGESRAGAGDSVNGTESRTSSAGGQASGCGGWAPILKLTP